MNPALLQKDASMPRSPKQVRAEQRFDFIQDAGIRNRMQPMAPMVAPDAFEVETPSISSHCVALLEYCHFRVRSSRKTQRGCDAGRPGAQNCDMLSLQSFELRGVPR